MKTAPLWTLTLEMAEKWGALPWMIDDSEPQIVWEERYKVLREAQIEKTQRDKDYA